MSQFFYEIRAHAPAMDSTQGDCYHTCAVAGPNSGGRVARVIKLLIANDKGGVGKSLLAQFCILALQGMKQAPRLVEYDRQPKLCRWFGSDHVATFAAGPAAMDDANSQAFWDPMAEWLGDAKPLVVDFGAQAWGGFQDWAEASDLAALHRGGVVRILVPVTADLEAIRAATSVVLGAKRILPDAKVLLLPLDKDGAVAMLEGVEAYDALTRAMVETGARRLHYPMLRAEALPALDARGWRIDRIVAVQDVAAFGVPLPKPALQRTITALRAWMAEMYRQLLPDLLAALGTRPGLPAAAPADLPPHVLLEWGHMLTELPTMAGTQPRVDARTLSPRDKR